MSQPDTTKTFVTGSTGDIGAQVVTLFSNANHQSQLRLLSRRQQQIDAFHARGFDAVVGDLDLDPSTLTAQISGCSTLLLISAAVPNQLQQCTAAIDAAIAAGCKWIIKISAADARDEGNVPWVKAHAAADRYLKKTADGRGVKWTILSASAFMQNILAEAPAVRFGILPQACGEGRAGWIDTADIAEVIFTLLQSSSPDQHASQTYILTGPALISMTDIAQSLTLATGHRVHYIDLPAPLFYALLKASGANDWMAKGLVAQFMEIVRPNLEGIEVSDAVERITGRPPRGFGEFARRNRGRLEGFDVVPWALGGLVGLVAVGMWYLM